jgi:hypothetical protein
MNPQEQLPLELCEEIGHLFPESFKVWGKHRLELNGFEIGRRSKLDQNRCITVQGLNIKSIANHPSITDMMEWLWAHGNIEIFRSHAMAGEEGKIENAWRFLFTTGVDLLPHKQRTIMATTPIEAYAQAVKLVMEMER